LALSTILNAGYFLPIVYRAFFKPLPAPGTPEPYDHSGHGHALAEHGEAPLPIVIALCLTAGGTLLLFFFPDVPLDLARSMLGVS
jgi:multicomponent Na+:H+ antiporter subunit D